MEQLVGLVHTTRLVVEPVHQAITESLASIGVNHILDEGILKKLAIEGKITDEIITWLEAMVMSAERGGADLAIVSCSSLSPCVNEVRSRVAIPVLKVDEPMMEYAIEKGDSIGLVMTNPTTEGPSRLLFAEVAERLGKSPSLTARLCPSAFTKLNAGDTAGHDEEVVETIEKLLTEVDIVMLAQISIARVKAILGADLQHRVLSSLDFIGSKTAQVLEKLAKST